MSGEFSRRSFLKYTALTAAAVAGAGLLSGCEHGSNPVLREVPSTNTVLKVKATLNSAVYDAAGKTATYELAVSNGRNSALNIGYKNFTVTADSYYAHMNDKIKVVCNDHPSAQVKNGESATYVITVTGLELSGEDTAVFTFQPDVPEYTEYSASWELTAAQMVADDTTGSEETEA